MSNAQDFLNSYTLKIASYLAWVNIPDISNATTKDERDTQIDNFKLEVGQKLFRRSASAVTAGVAVYGIFDTKDEEKALESWQDNVELGLGLIAAGLLFIKQDMEFQCERAKACDFKA